MLRFQHAYSAAGARADGDGRELLVSSTRSAGSGCSDGRVTNADAGRAARSPTCSASHDRLAQLAERAVERQAHPARRGRPVRHRPRAVPAQPGRRPQQYQRNVDEAQGWLEANDIAMGNVTTLMQRARELTVQAANGSLDQTGLNGIAAEIGQIRDVGARADEREVRRPLDLLRHADADRPVPARPALHLRRQRQHHPARRSATARRSTSTSAAGRRSASRARTRAPTSSTMLDHARDRPRGRQQGRHRQRRPERARRGTSTS